MTLCGYYVCLVVLCLSVVILCLFVVGLHLFVTVLHLLVICVRSLSGHFVSLCDLFEVVFLGSTSCCTLFVFIRNENIFVFWFLVLLNYFSPSLLLLF